MLRIMHVMRSPVGGLFRHVLDLSREQIARGIAVGIICDRETGGERAADTFMELAGHYRLGIHRVAMGRLPGWSDVAATSHVTAMIAAARADIIHGHGAKGGAYARLAARRLADANGPRPCFYTPHGGTLHYDPRSMQGRVFFAFERWAQKATSAILFESQYGSGVYSRKVGESSCPTQIVHNGLKLAEFEPVKTTDDPYDLLFIGEMRKLKGVAILLEALSMLRDQGRTPRVLLVGSGPDETAFKEQARTLGIADSVTFQPAMPARDAFAMARAVVVPSLNESLPYVVLEAGAAGLPLIATTVGGIPEIFSGEAYRLVAPGDSRRLADGIAKVLDAPDKALHAAEKLRSTLVSRFSVEAMTDGVLTAYLRYARLPEHRLGLLSAAVDSAISADRTA